MAGRYEDIDVAGAGANPILPGIPGNVIIVYQYSLVCAANVILTWESSGGTILGGPMSHIANGGIVNAFNPNGLFQTLPGEGLILNLNAAVQVGGHIQYLYQRG